MRFDPTFHEAASSSYPLGIECGHCIRRVLLFAKEALKAQPGDTRKISEGSLRCAKCGSREFTAVVFDRKSEVYNYTRNY